MTILVTGGAGYIGSHASFRLIELGYKVIIVDNLSTGFRWALPPEADFFEGDIADSTLLDPIFKKWKIDAVFHFAAYVEVEESVRDPLKYFNNNTAKAISFFSTCERHGVKNIIFSSTAAVYGSTQSGRVDESTTLNPINPYGSSKLLTEMFLRSCSDSQFGKFNTLILRYFNVAGASNKHPIGPAHPNGTHLIKALCQVATGQKKSLKIFGTDYETADGTCVRDYIHVEDLVEAHILGLHHLTKKTAPSLTILNCGYGRGVSVKEMVQTFQAATGIQINVSYEARRAGDPAQLIADSSQLLHLLNWHPKYNNTAQICKSAYDWEKALLTKKA